MIKLLTLPQLRIVHEATVFFRNVAPKTNLRSMFRESGRDMNVGLALSVGHDHFVVRQVIPCDVSDDDLADMLVNLLVQIDNSHIRVLGRPIAVG